MNINYIFSGLCDFINCRLPAEVKRRLKALKKIQYDIFNVEAEFYQRVREVEYEFQSKYEKYYEMVIDTLINNN